MERERERIDQPPQTQTQQPFYSSTKAGPLRTRQVNKALFNQKNERYSRAVGPPPKKENTTTEFQLQTEVRSWWDLETGTYRGANGANPLSFIAIPRVKPRDILLCSAHPKGEMSALDANIQDEAPRNGGGSPGARWVGWGSPGPRDRGAEPGHAFSGGSEGWENRGRMPGGAVFGGCGGGGLRLVSWIGAHRACPEGTRSGRSVLEAFPTAALSLLPVFRG
jgi:hypothetical protein